MIEKDIGAKMEQETDSHDICVTWRGKNYVVNVNSHATLEELGQELQKLTAVRTDTMKLIVRSHKTSKLLSPFSHEHSCLTVHETSINKGKSIRMMGAPKEEIDHVLQNAKMDMRIAGFDEEEKRMMNRTSNGPHGSLKLPQGNYIFGHFKTLDLPGIELNPPASEALRLMQTLAADPGITAVMNKHRWRVGIMTEMAPEGYVGVSPVCVLGLNKNKGEEISLRLRTDDLKGFRKYQSIKKTLLHELAHMIFSEHDADFYALDKQLNHEAIALDWARSTGHTLSGARRMQHCEPEFHVTNDSSSLSHKLGENLSSVRLGSARASSVAAAYQRIALASSNPSRTFEADKEPDPDDCMDVNINDEQYEPGPDDSIKGEAMGPDPDECEILVMKYEPDPDDSINGEAMEPDECEILARKYEPDPDDSMNGEAMEPDECEILARKYEPDPDDSINGEAMGPDEIEVGQRTCVGVSENDEVKRDSKEPDPDDSQTDRMTVAEPHPDDDDELQRIQDPVMVACNRLKKSIETLQAEVDPVEAVTVIQTLFKIIRNVIEHPDETKFRKLRKANPVIQRNIANYKGAMEILLLIGFCEEDECYLVLKRDDPGLLWLAKSSLETCVAY